MKFFSSAVAAIYDRRSLWDLFPKASTVIDRRRGILLLVSILAVTACSNVSSKIANIKPGMKTDEVTAILGQPAHIDHAETTGLQGDVYYYPSSSGQGRVVFLNSAVFKAEFIPGAKS